MALYWKNLLTPGLDNQQNKAAIYTDFHGVNTSNMANFKLQMWYQGTQIWEEVLSSIPL